MTAKVWRRRSRSFSRPTRKGDPLPETDLDEAEKAWRLAVEKARDRVYEEMPGQKANRVTHVRPHDSEARYDKDPFSEKHRCFWLNQTYIKHINEAQGIRQLHD